MTKRYALVKGHELLGDVKYWAYLSNSGRLTISGPIHSNLIKTQYTEAHWNTLGVNENNAVFVKVGNNE